MIHVMRVAEDTEWRQTELQSDISRPGVLKLSLVLELIRESTWVTMSFAGTACNNLL